jgi:hypothetical protein
MLSYAAERGRGRAIALIWVILNVGGTVAGLISFGLNFHSKAGRCRTLHVSVVTFLPISLL